MGGAFRDPPDEDAGEKKPTPLPVPAAAGFMYGRCECSLLGAVAAKEAHTPGWLVYCPIAAGDIAPYMPPPSCCGGWPLEWGDGTCLSDDDEEDDDHRPTGA